MLSLPLSQIAAWCEARLLGADVNVDSVSTDSRSLQPGALFVALSGERFDGHDFVQQAATAGAAALLVERLVETPLPQLLCSDTLAALGDLAGGVRDGLDACVLGLTGSNGKTTVKSLLHGILARLGPAYANAGNRNNQIGLPLSVLECPQDARYAIFEMGAGQPGDIGYLAAIARPRIALVNNVAPAHLERMGSLLGVAQTKSAIYEALPADGVAVINADDAFAPYFVERSAKCRVLRFGLECSAEVSAEQIRMDADGTRLRLLAPQGIAALRLPLPGRHNVLNALAAASMALAAGADLDTVVAGLQAAQPVPGRQQRHALPGGALLIDDSYNANPASVAAAIATLAALGGETWLVLGDMAELGPGSEALHAQVGSDARTAGVSRLYTVGSLARVAAQAFDGGVRHYATQADLLAVLQADLHRGVSLLVKGSRSSAMDKVVAQLRAVEAASDVA